MISESCSMQSPSARLCELNIDLGLGAQASCLQVFSLAFVRANERAGMEAQL
jgi:hypothetical protein